MGEFDAAIKKLEKERMKLSSQLADINTAIEALMRIGGNNTSESSNIIINSKTDKPLQYSDYIVVIPSKYAEDLTLPEKLIYAISKNGGGAFAHEAAELIHEIDEKNNLEYIKKRFTDIASSLARANKLTYKKIGKKYKYSLINDENDEHKKGQQDAAQL